MSRTSAPENPLGRTLEPAVLPSLSHQMLVHGMQHLNQQLTNKKQSFEADSWHTPASSSGHSSDAQHLDSAKACKAPG